MIRVGSLGIAAINRVVDALGVGDSLVVVLAKGR
jgi:hypothetical protein